MYMYIINTLYHQYPCSDHQVHQILVYQFGTKKQLSENIDYMHMYMYNTCNYKNTSGGPGQLESA